MSIPPIVLSKPVVLLGRGGGGTRLLSDIVQSLGFFFGNNLNESQDSVEWVDLVYHLVRETYPLDGQRDTGTFTREVSQLRHKAEAILATGKVAPDGEWGWKLPETTLLAQHAASAFPYARFIQLARHPVTACCRRTHMTSRLASPIGTHSLTAAYRHIGRPLDLLEADPEHIWNAASWAHQADLIKAAMSAGANPSKHICVRFEDICDSPRTVAETICGFLDLPHDRIGTLPVVDAGRINTQTWAAQDAADVWAICARQAAHLGYADPDPAG